MSQRSTMLFVITFVIILLFISIIPQLVKHLFVHPTGNFKAIGLTFGLIISFAILLKWKYTRVLFYFVFIPLMLFDLLIVIHLDTNFWISHLFLVSSHIILLLTFWKSKNISIYLNKNAGVLQ